MLREDDVLRALGRPRHLPRGFAWAGGLLVFIVYVAMYLPLLPLGVPLLPLAQSLSTGRMPDRVRIVNQGRLPGLPFDLNWKISLAGATEPFVPDEVTYSIAYVRDRGSCRETVHLATSEILFVPDPYQSSMGRLTPHEVRWVNQSHKRDPLVLLNLPVTWLEWQRSSPDRHHDIYRVWNVHGRTSGPGSHEAVYPIIEYHDERRQARLVRNRVLDCNNN